MCHPTYHKSQADVGGGGYYSEGWTQPGRWRWLLLLVNQKKKRRTGGIEYQAGWKSWWPQMGASRVSQGWKKKKIRKSQAKLERCRGMFGCREIFNNKGSVSTLFFLWCVAKMASSFLPLLSLFLFGDVFDLLELSDCWGGKKNKKKVDLFLFSYFIFAPLRVSIWGLPR